MKYLSIQIQTNRDESFSVEDAIDLSRALGRFPEVDKADDKGKFIHLNYFSEDLTALWSELRAGLLDDGTLGEWLRKVSVVVCEGPTNPDEYLLLWHWDSEEKLDVL